MSAFFNFGTMDAVTIGLASIDVFHHFLAIECGQPTIKAGDDYFCEPKEVITYKPTSRARKHSPAVNFFPYKMRGPHDAAIEAMRNHSRANPTIKIRLPTLCDHGDLKSMIVQHSNKDGTPLSDIETYRACATYLKLDDVDYDIEKMRVERKRLFDLWTAGVEAPVHDTRDEYEQNRRSTDKCDDPDCDNWADTTGFCSVHRGHHKKQKVEKAEEKGRGKADDEAQEEASEKADEEQIKREQGPRDECCDAAFL